MHFSSPFFGDGAGALGTCRHVQLFIGHVDFEEETTKLSRNVGGQSHSDVAPHPTTKLSRNVGGQSHSDVAPHPTRTGDLFFSSASYILSSLLTSLFSLFPSPFPFVSYLLFRPISLRHFIFHSTCLSLNDGQLSPPVINQ